MNYICVSGGADSTAMALLAWEQGEEFEMVFSDTGAELPETYWLLPRLAEKVGKPLTVVGNGSFFQHLCTLGFMLPGPVKRWCTRLLKETPQDHYFQSKNAERVMVGIRADEPRRLVPRNARYGNHEFFYPLADAGFGKKEVIAFCKRHDLLNPVYEWRSNVSCFCCFFQKKRDWRGLLKNHPSIYALAQEWERQSILRTRMGYTWNHSFSLEIFRKATQDQIEMWPEPDAEPCLICSV